MATSDSDNFESADEELMAQNTPSRKSRAHQPWQSPNSTIGSESDDDNECVPSVGSKAWNASNRSVQSSGQKKRSRTDMKSKKLLSGVTEEKNPQMEANTRLESSERKEPEISKKSNTDSKDPSSEDIKDQSGNKKIPAEEKPAPGRREKPERQKKSKETKTLGAKKLGSKLNLEGEPKPPEPEALTPADIRKKALAEGKEPPMIEECWEFDEEETAKILKGLPNVNKVQMPEELKSDKKFKEIFKPDGWEGLDDEKILSELEEDRIRPVLEKIAGEDKSNSGWGSWGSWGVSSLINTATASVSTLTSHVTHGLTLLDEAMAAQMPEELPKSESTDVVDQTVEEDNKNTVEEPQSQLSFGFNDLLSGVSSITKLVETTGTRVITGGLGTLETIGKKTMEVLQEGDPGLKKKRAFFLNEGDKPILSQMLREAKEKAELEEKTIEEKEMSRKIHFESLFDDYQGLVHLEALEMLSKQCNMKIQQRLVSLDLDELTSLQETLEEVKELCDLGEEEEEDEDKDDLQERLKAAFKDLGVAITYENLNDIWTDTKTYISEVSSPESTSNEREIFERAISTLARFTAFSVERFHKTAELLLIKEHRSTVIEADALVQLTKIFTGQIGIAANLFSSHINDRIKKMEQPNSKVDVTTIFLEAANASSYIQDAFRLLIPILQVGAI